VSFFDAAYQGTPPWDIGRPQPAFVRLEERGEIVGRVLDLGCGTGENALYFARVGHEAWGFDSAPTAIRLAREKSARRGLPVRFEVADALELDRRPERFETITDCGLFHTFDDEERPRYAASLRAALGSPGRVHVLCFSDREPAEWGGPRRVTQDEIRATFGEGWRVRSIRAERFATRFEEIRGEAWLATVEPSGADRVEGERFERVRERPPVRGASTSP